MDRIDFYSINLHSKLRSQFSMVMIIPFTYLFLADHRNLWTRSRPSPEHRGWREHTSGRSLASLYYLPGSESVCRLWHLTSPLEFLAKQINLSIQSINKLTDIYHDMFLIQIFEKIFLCPVHTEAILILHIEWISS